MQTLELGRELGKLFQQQSKSLNGLAQYLHNHLFARVASGQPSVNQLVQMLQAIVDGRPLPFDGIFLRSFNELSARYFSDGDALSEMTILDRLAWAASLDLLRELGIRMPNIQ